MKRPITLKLAAIFMLVLALVVGGFSAAQQFGLLRSALGAGRTGVLAFEENGTRPRNFQGQFPSGTPNPDQGGGQFFVTPGDGTQPDVQVNPSDGTIPTFRQFNGDGTGTRLRGTTGFTFLAGFSSLQNWLGMGLAVLGLLAAFLLWKPARWGIILSVILGLLIILISLPSMLSLSMLFTFPALVVWSVVPGIIQIVLALTVLVLALLPASRRAVRRVVATASGDDSEEEEPERVVL